MKKLYSLLLIFMLLPFTAWGDPITPEDGSTTTLGKEQITITSGGTYTITGTYSGTFSGNILTVNTSDKVDLTLEDVTIYQDEASGSFLALSLQEGADVTLTLKGKNKLMGAGVNGWAISVPKGSTLTIKGDGSLDVSTKEYSYATGGGIGAENAGTIIIEGGTIVATGAKSTPAIGGEESFEGIQIKGGDVTASVTEGGNNNAAGIGLGRLSSLSETKSGNIEITGGKVTASGNDGGTGIGCIYAKQNETLDITIGGNANVTAMGGRKAAGIGGGYYSLEEKETRVNVTIQGDATVTAIGGEGGGAGIGSAYDSKNSGAIKIIGNATVTATGGIDGSYAGAGIGSGDGASEFGSIYINTTGTVTATGGHREGKITGYTAIGGNNGEGTIEIVSGTIIATGTSKNFGEGSIVSPSKISITGDAYIHAVFAEGVTSSEDAIYVYKGYNNYEKITIADNTNAVIIADGIEANEEWNGVLIIDNKESTGTIYGNEVTVNREIEIPDDIVMTIKEGQSLKVGDEGKITNNGKIICYGTIEGATNGEMGTILKKIQQDEIEVAVEEDKSYDGTAPKVTVTVNDKDAEARTFTIESYTYYKVEEGKDRKIDEAPTDAGNYKVKVKVKGAGQADEEGYGYMEEEVESEAVEFTITPVKVMITVNDAEKTYGDDDPEFAYTKNPENVNLGEITIARQEGDENKRNVGDDITLTATYTANGNYAVDVTTAKLTIKKKAITVTADDKEMVYGSTEPELTFTVPEGALAYDDTPEDLHITLTRTEGTDVNQYTITGKASVECKNYDVTVTAGTLTITAAQYTLEFEQDEVTKLVTDEPFTNKLTVSPDDASITYKSNDESIASVDAETGEVTIHKVGEVEITATAAASGNYAETTVSYTLTIQAEPTEPDEPVIPDLPNYYNIYVEDCEGVTVELSKAVVKEGNSTSFTVEVEEGYNAQDMKVTIKRSLFGYAEEIEPDEDGKYNVPNIWTDIYVTIEGVEEENPTGMEDIEGVKVYTKEGTLCVQTPSREQVMIINMTGAVVKIEEQVGMQRYDLERGIYIVRVGEKIYKVRI